eukprot:UC1_evm2s630
MMGLFSQPLHDVVLPRWAPVAILTAVAGGVWYLRQRREMAPNTPLARYYWPILGHSLVVYRETSRLLDYIWEECKLHDDGPFQFKVLGQPPFVVITDPADVQHMLADNFDNYVKGELFRDKFYELLGDGIFDVDGPEWQYQRKVAARIFTRRELQGFMSEVFQDHVDKAMTKLDEAAADAPNTIVDLQDIFFRYTLESIGKIAYGVEFGCFEAESVEFATNFDVAQAISQERMFSPIWPLRRLLWPLFPDEWRLRACVKRLNALCQGIVEQRRQEARDDMEGREDLLSHFMRVIDDAGKPLSDRRLRDVVMSFVIAGRDTTANALTWACWELARHPDMLKMARAELIERVGRNCVPGYEDVHRNLPYLHAVVKETLRLHPSVGKDAKVCLHGDTMPSGTVLPAGVSTVYMPYVMGRMKGLWGDSAESFEPKRWLTGEPEPSPFKYIAFNAGPRLCLGQNMAYLEAKFMLASLLLNYDFVVTEGHDPAYAVTLTLPMRNGLPVRIRRRHEDEEA